MNPYRSKKAKARILETYDLLLKEWGIPVEERMVPTRYGDTHVTICGAEDGSPLILFHGVGDDSALMWLYNARELGQHFRLYAVDTMGGPGKSTIGPRYRKEFDHGYWVDDLLQGLSLAKASFAGVSHGGYMVQLIALLRPNQVDKAISMASAVPYGASANPMKTMLRIFLPEALFPTRGNTVRLMKKLCGSRHHVFTEQPLIMEHYAWLLKGFNNMAMGPHKVRAFTKEEVDKLRDKVFYLVGEEDPFQKLGGTEALRGCRMNARFFKDTGHGINHEIADEINSVIIDIMQGRVTIL